MNDMTDEPKEEQAAQKPPEKQEPEHKPAASNERGLNFLLDIPLELTVELGRTRMPIRDILSLNQGSIIELGKQAGDPLDIMINDKLVARGEAVVINDKFGVRITEILSPAERVEKLST